MVRTLCTRGNHELLKSGVHGAAGAIAALMAAYNIAACCFRREPHLRINAAVYTVAVAWELKQTLHHLHCLTVGMAACDEPIASTPRVA